jgi:hypothetical protein
MLEETLKEANETLKKTDELLRKLEKSSKMITQYVQTSILSVKFKQNE